MIRSKHFRQLRWCNDQWITPVWIFSKLGAKKVSLNCYWAYGLCIHADLNCPELPAHPEPNAEPDVVVRTMSPCSSVSETLEQGYYEVRPGVFRLAIPGVGQYTVEEGKRIFIEPLADSSMDKVRLFLLGSSLGALLYQRGLFPLHGSAVETRWGAMIFVGAQGAGKSTLASQFHRKGYRLLSDDICAVASTSEGLRILPALAQFRLCADAYERLGCSEGARFDVDKFVVPMGEGYCPEPIPLGAIHVLSDHDEVLPKVEAMRGFDRIQRLLENLYRPHYMKGQETQAGVMRLAGTIAQQAPLFSVARRRDTAGIESLVGSLEMAWRDYFPVSSGMEGS
jgi:hypothetical protein